MISSVDSNGVASVWWSGVARMAHAGLLQNHSALLDPNEFPCVQPGATKSHQPPTEPRAASVMVAVWQTESHMRTHFADDTRTWSVLRKPSPDFVGNFRLEEPQFRKARRSEGLIFIEAGACLEISPVKTAAANRAHS